MARAIARELVVARELTVEERVERIERWGEWALYGALGFLFFVWLMAVARR